MTNRMKILGFALLAWPIGMMFSGCSDRGENQAKARFQDYMTAWQERDFHRVWEIMSPHLKAQNGNEAHFTDFVKKQNIRPASFEVQKIDVKEDHATVIVDMTGGELSSDKIFGTERQMCQLILYQGLWYFDSCKLAR